VPCYIAADQVQTPKEGKFEWAIENKAEILTFQK
jgi:hypothetical protein